MLRSLLLEIVARARGALKAGAPDDRRGVASNEVRQVLEEGDARWRSGDRDAARACYVRALALEPANTVARYTLAVLDAQDGEYAAATARLNGVLQDRPDHAPAWNALGNINKLQRRWQEAATCYRRAAELDPGLAAALSNLGICLRNQGREVEAIDYLARAATLASADSEILFNYFLGLIDVGRAEEGQRGLLEMLRQDPGHAEAHVALACQLLVSGRYGEGWREYEWRCRTESWERRNAEYPLPWWRGEALRGRRLLVRAEQGLGDQIMFASCLTELMRQDGKLVVECEPRLVSLFRRSFGGAEVRAQPALSTGHASGAAPEVQVNIGSLPGLLGRTQGKFPAHEGYLVPDPDRKQFWRERLAALGPGLKVGLSWRGGTWNTRNLSRSISLSDFAPHLRCDSSTLVSVQYGDHAREIADLQSAEGTIVHHWREAMDDHDETAALVAALDLVISVQTAVVHLAGAIGTRVWALIPRRPEWRYLDEGETMPWYPSVRLFRQSAEGSWTPVVEQIAAELSRLAASCR
jgi:tetratricopeptide (TPR) repeat protein